MHVPQNLGNKNNEEAYILNNFAGINTARRKAYLCAEDDDQRKRVVDNSPRDGKVVQVVPFEQNLSCLEPGGSLDVGTVCRETLWDDGASSPEHSPPCVNQLVLSVLVHLLDIGSEAEWVIPVVAGEGSVEVGRDVVKREEATRQIELSSSSVPFAQVTASTFAATPTLGGLGRLASLLCFPSEPHRGRGPLGHHHAHGLSLLLLLLLSLSLSSFANGARSVFSYPH